MIRSINLISFLLALYCTFFSSSLLAQDLYEGLEAHYKFDGNLRDASGNDNHLERFEGELEYTSVIGGDFSIVLNGESGARSVDPFDCSHFTEQAVSLWIRTSTVTSAHQTIAAGAYIGFSVATFSESGNVMAFMDGSSIGAYESTVSIADGNWHHVIMQSAGEETQLYIDGQLDGTLVETLKVGDGSSNNRLMLGISNLRLTPYTGEANDLRIYSRILTESEIAELSKPNGTTSTDSPPLRPTINIYPNPTTNYINWLPELPKSYTLFNSNGQKVRVGQGTRIDVIGLPLGMYYLKLEGEKLRKVVIQHRGVYP